MSILLNKNEQAERQLRQMQELRDYKKLIKDARRWQTAQLIRNYITNTPDSDSQWVDWANQKANWIDPNIAVENEWLNDMDKDVV